MAILKVVQYPRPVLRRKAHCVSMTNRGQMRRFILDMIETMYAADGVGLAAPQVGVSKQIIVISPTTRRGHERVLFNPQLIERSSEQEVGLEGCLSVPGVTAEIKRARKITFTALDAKGRPVTETAEGFTARVIQHEVDHLNGILIVHDVGSPHRSHRARVGWRDL